MNGCDQIIFFIFVASMTVRIVTTEMFTSISAMKEIVHSERILIENLQNYIDLERSRLEILEAKLNHYKVKNAEATSISDFILSPINAFVMIKRLTSEWREVEQVMIVNSSAVTLQNITALKTDHKFPDDEDLNGAAVALCRLQDTYLLSTTDVSCGIINGVQGSIVMTPADCFEIGKQMYFTGDDYHASVWLREALHKFELQKLADLKLKEQILEYLQHVTYKQGHWLTALALATDVLDINPGNTVVNTDREYYEHTLNVMKENGTFSTLKDTSIYELVLKPSKNVNNILTSKDRSALNNLCRGNYDKSPERLAQLHCKFQKDTHFSKIAPLKFEEIHHDPTIVIFYDVLSDHEITVIKDLVKKKVKRAEVVGANKVNYRICQSGWLDDENHKCIQGISKRIEDMTGMTTKTAELLQIVNYGIGGQYDSHVDFFKGERAVLNEDGNRIATVLFYMSDVQIGGSTVFVNLNIGIQPKKGTAVVWYNLHRSGEGDERTRHASCPVLIGSKWICTKWLHAFGQERARPCGLKPDYMEN